MRQVSPSTLHFLYVLLGFCIGFGVGVFCGLTAERRDDGDKK